MPAHRPPYRDELLARANSESAKERSKALAAFLDLSDTEAVAPSTGLKLKQDGELSLIRGLYPT